ncbi:TetR/AcrR family transcriptional regulator [Rhizobium lusitanum]|nr:TetR/AcrR family transcriptional regulator [Rhizobium lusitanum]
MSAYEVLVSNITQSFLDHGYESMTMIKLAKCCNITRRGLYHHFSSKEEAFHAMVVQNNENTRRDSLREGGRLLSTGANVLDIITAILDVRYGDTRRKLALSPYALEVNDYAFRLCRPAMIEAAAIFQADFAALLERAVVSGLLMLLPSISIKTLVQLLCDGARGTNQSFFAPAPEEIAARYREMSRAILYGCAEPAKP